jgi:long-chain acyl-CoA synthetase
MAGFVASSATVAEVIASTPLKTIITVGPADGSAAKLRSPPVDPRLSGTLAFSDAVANGAKLAFDPVDLNGDDLLFLQYMGGTTELAKGGSLSHRNLVANTEQLRTYLGRVIRDITPRFVVRRAKAKSKPHKGSD